MDQFATPQFWVAVAQIIVIDVLLAGDNAMVIALACRNLPPDLQKRGVFWGVVGAIGLRVVLTVFAGALLTLPWLKIVGAVALLWIGVKLLVPQDEGGHEIEGRRDLWGAVRTVILADLVMSLDNVIAVAGAAKGNVPLLIFGLVVSIPLVAAGSKIVLRLIERYPVVITLGGALLGWIAGELIATDPGIAATMARLPSWSGYVFAAAGALLVVLTARALDRRHRRAGGG